MPHPSHADPIVALRAALLVMDATGARGFEGLVAALIEDVTGGRLRLMRSGTQSGGDAVADPGPMRRAMQSKRYAQSTALNAVGMVGELAEAAENFPDLDCWIIPTTKAVAAQEAARLRVQAELHGLSLMLLDWAAPKGQIPPLAVLCAASPATTNAYLAGVGDVLGALRGSAEWPDAEAALRAHLTRVDVGFTTAARASGARLARVFADPGIARTLIGTSASFLADNPPIGRSALALKLAECLASDTPTALLGEEGVGKSWAALEALRKAAEAEPDDRVVLFVRGRFAARYAGLVAAAVASLVDLGERTGHTLKDPPAFWRRRLSLWARSDQLRGRIVVLVDGLDEAPFDFLWEDWLAEASDPHWNGLIRPLLTCRPYRWNGRLNKLASLNAPITEIPVPIFSPAERDAFLAARAINGALLSPKVREAALHPRTAFHITRLKTELDDLSTVTREQLLLRDFEHRQVVGGAKALTDQQFRALVVTFGMQARDAASRQGVFSIGEGEAVEVAQGISASERNQLALVLSELVDGGWWEADPGNPARLKFRNAALPDAVGLALAGQVRNLPLADVEDAVAQFLEPWGADDLAEKVLRTCAAAFILDPTASDDVCTTILTMWSARPHWGPGQDFWWRMHAARPHLFLEFCDQQGGTGGDWLLEWAIAKTWEQYPRLRPVIEAYVHRWMSHAPYPINPGASPLVARQKKRQLKRASLLDKHAPFWRRLIGYEDARAPARLASACRIIDMLPREPFRESIVAWALAYSAAGRDEGLQAVAWLLRREGSRELTLWTRDAASALVARGEAISAAAARRLLVALGWPQDARAAGGIDRDHAALRRKPRRPALANDKVVRPASLRRLLLAAAPGAADPGKQLDAASIADIQAAIDKANTAELAACFVSGGDRMLDVLGRWLPDRLSTVLTKIAEDSATPWRERVAAAEQAIPFLEVATREVLAAQLTAAMASDQEGDVREKKLLLMAMRLAGRPFAEQLEGRLTPEWLDVAAKPLSQMLAIPTHAEMTKAINELVGQSEPRLTLGMELMAELAWRMPDGDLAIAWPPLLFHTSDRIRTSAFSLAACFKARDASDALMSSAWSAHADTDTARRFCGSRLLCLQHDDRVDEVVDRIGREHCARLVLDGRDGTGRALDRAWAWFDAELNPPSSRSFGGGEWNYRFAYRCQLAAAVIDARPELAVSLLKAKWAEGGKSALALDFAFGDLTLFLEGVAKHAPELVAEIWRAAAVESRRGFHSDALDHFPARLPAMSPFDALREEMLNIARNDEALFNAARQMQANGHSGELLGHIRHDLVSDDIYARANAITLAGFLDESDDAWSVWRDIPDNEDGWLGEVIAAARVWWTRNLWARHWAAITIAADDELSAYAAFRLFTATVDDRAALWISKPAYRLNDRPWRARWLTYFDDEPRGARKEKRELGRRQSAHTNHADRYVYWR